MFPIELAEKIREGEIDVNNRQLFFSTIFKGLLWHLNRSISIRGVKIPHFVVSTGDEIMFLEVKGQNMSLEPKEVSNEDYIYTTVPRCAVSPQGINIDVSQLSNPHVDGQFQLDYMDNLATFSAEFRRMPVTMSVELQYVVDSYTDYLSLVQQIITNLAFINNYKVVYMGQEIPCSYAMPESLDGDHNIDMDETSKDDRRIKVTVAVELESVLPVFNAATVKPAGTVIKHIKDDPDGGYYTNDGKPILVQDLNLVRKGGIAQGDTGESAHVDCDNNKQVYQVVDSEGNWVYDAEGHRICTL